MSVLNKMNVSAEELKSIIVEILDEREVEGSEVIADHMVEAELRGHSSHGVQRLIPLVKGVELGTISRRLQYDVLKKERGSMWIDGKHSVGIVLWNQLIQHEFHEPSSVIAVKSASHIGFLGYYTDKLATRGYVGIMFGNAEPAVVLPGTSRKLLSTTPLSIGIPHNPPIVLDMALSSTSRGKILEAQRKGEPIPEGWAVDSEGKPTINPELALRGGILPIGGIRGFYLMLVLEILTSFISGSAMGPNVKGVLNTENPPNKGEILIVINPSYFASYTEQIDEIRKLLGMEFPGEHGLQLKARRLTEGIPMDAQLWSTLVKMKEKVPFFI